jgi:hypothetical protein
MRSVKRGLADINKALEEATFIVNSCWPDIMKLASHLQAHHELTFPQISTLLDLTNCQAIYNEGNRPDIQCL